MHGTKLCMKWDFDQGLHMTFICGSPFFKILLTSSSADSFSTADQPESNLEGWLFRTSNLIPKYFYPAQLFHLCSFILEILSRVLIVSLKYPLESRVWESDHSKKFIFVSKHPCMSAHKYHWFHCSSTRGSSPYSRTHFPSSLFAYQVLFCACP